MDGTKYNKKDVIDEYESIREQVINKYFQKKNTIDFQIL